MEIEKDNFNRILRRLIELAKEREQIISQSEIDEAWSSIERATDIKLDLQRRKKRMRFYYISAAAAAMVAVAILLFNSITFATDEAGALMEYVATGRGNYNQLTTPLGSKNHITFSDGSQIWMNSGTKIIYPAKFSDKSRNIYIEGEAYLNIAHNEAAPFIVHTKNATVRVLGTAFNVSAYAKENSTEVVLVRGKVDLSNGKDSHVVLSPGELSSVVADEVKQPVAVDVEQYICWIDDMLIFHDDTLKKVFSRLNAHYGVEFVLGPGVDERKVTGKLNLKDDIDEVMRTISFTSSISYRKSNGKIWVNVTD